MTLSLKTAARNVIDNWEGGDLAAAVRDLDAALLASEPVSREPEVEEPMFRIFYTCPDCGEEWEDTHTSACDAECPKCDARNISPVDWEDADEAEA